ncbi:hypothetical protein AAMO2058_000223800 [Amorphochlora amoebiformis]
MCVTREHMEESVLSRINTSQVAPPPEPLLYDTSKANSESSFYLEPPEPLVVRSSSTPHLRSLCATPTQEKAHMRKMGVKIRKKSGPRHVRSAYSTPTVNSGSGHARSASTLAVEIVKEERNPSTIRGKLREGSKRRSKSDCSRISSRRIQPVEELEYSGFLLKSVVSDMSGMKPIGPKNKVDSMDKDLGYRERLQTIPEEFPQEATARLIRKIKINLGVSAQYKKFKKYKESISGSQIIDWLLEERVVPNEDQACALGTWMICQGFLFPVQGRKIHMTRRNLYTYGDSKTAGYSKIVERYSNYGEAKELASRMFSEIPEKVVRRRFKKIRHCYSGASIIQWIKEDVRKGTDPNLIGTVLLLHGLMKEISTKNETSYKIRTDTVYIKSFESTEVSLLDNPMFDLDDGNESSISSKGIDSKRQRMRRRSMPNRSPTANLQAMSGMQGWLEKKSKLGFWKKRYFRLQLRHKELGSHLAYFLDEDPQTVARGTIPLSQINSVMREAKCLTLRMSSKHKGKAYYYLRCKCDLDAQKWGGALQPFVKATTLLEVLNQSALGLLLTDRQKAVFAKSMKFKTFNDRSWVQKSRQTADSFFILSHGKIGIYVSHNEGKNESEELLTYQTPISHFGEEMFMGKVCGASIRAESEIRCAVLDREHCQIFLKKFPEVKEDIAKFFGKGVVQLLQKVSFLKPLPLEKLDILRLGVHFMPFLAEQVVFYEGDVGEYFYMVLRGAVLVKRRDPVTKNEIDIVNLDEGSYFGEVSLIMDCARTASILVLMPTVLLAINKKTFDAFLKIAGLDLRSVMRTRIIETFKKFRIPFFQAIPNESFPIVAEGCSIVKYDKGETVYDEGDIGDRFYIISYGQVEVIRKGKTIGKLESGKYFGEVALVVEDATRTEKVVTCMQTVLLTMTAEDFQGSFHSNPEALADVELKIAGKNSGIRAILHHPLAFVEFSRFLAQQFATESINCWKAITKFTRLYQKFLEFRELGKTEQAWDKNSELRVLAKYIVNQYINVGSEEEVNIPDQLRRDTMRIAETKTLSADSFAGVETELVRLMRNDKLSSFQRTDGFRRILSLVGNYGELTDKKMKNKIVKGSRKLTRRSSLNPRSVIKSAESKDATLDKARSVFDKPLLSPSESLRLVSPANITRKGSSNHALNIT